MPGRFVVTLASDTPVAVTGGNALTIGMVAPASGYKVKVVAVEVVTTTGVSPTDGLIPIKCLANGVNNAGTFTSVTPAKLNSKDGSINATAGKNASVEPSGTQRTFHHRTFHPQVPFAWYPVPGFEPILNDTTEQFNIWVKPPQTQSFLFTITCEEF